MLRLALASLLLCACGDDGPLDLAVDAPAAPPFPECPAATRDGGVADRGWEVWCADGVVWVNDLTERLYTDDEGTVVCQLRTRPESFMSTTCASGTCASAERRAFSDFQSYNAFAQASLCAP